MSQWLDSFREARVDAGISVPIVPIAPIGANQKAIGTIGAIGTGVEKEARGPSPPWDAADWQAMYDERAAIREFDGELPRPEAERLALADTVDQWLTQHPPPATDDSDGCVHCGDPLDDGAIPVLAGDRGHVWLHGRCHRNWLDERRRQAGEALRAMGIRVAGTHG